MDCFASVPAEEYSAMNKAGQDNVCRNEANTVRDLISSGQINFASILGERIKTFDVVNTEWLYWTKMKAYLNTNALN